jgi:CubicO group peptidase (beta-lactamase class C family)
VQPSFGRVLRPAVVAVALLTTACMHTAGESRQASASSSPSDRAASAGGGSSDARAATKIALTLSSETFKRVRGVVVIADGRTVFEQYYNGSASQARDVESVTKSVMSTLVGIALDEGKLHSLDQNLAELLPSYAASMKPAVAAITLRQVLTMTAGFAGEPTDNSSNSSAFTASPDWVRGVLSDVVQEPGKGFDYSNGDAHLLSAILVTATGQSVLDYARVKLFDPLGIVTRPAAQPLAVASNIPAYDRAAFAWPVDPQGRNTGWTLLKLRPADMAKIGMLYLNGGQWNGRRIVSAAWVREATKAQVPGVRTGDAYGYMWWVTTADGDPAFLASGFGGQMIEVVPRRRLVVVVSTALDLADPNDRGVESSSLTSMVDTVIAPAFRP